MQTDGRWKNKWEHNRWNQWTPSLLHKKYLYSVIWTYQVTVSEYQIRILASYITAVKWGRSISVVNNYTCWCCVIVIGKGLTLIGSVIEGDYAEKYASALAAKQTVNTMMKKEKAPGFAEVIVADSTVQGLSYLYVGCCFLTYLYRV